MSQPFYRYMQQLSLCMMTYQFIEFSLRYCLHRCHGIIKFRLDGHLPYQAPAQAIEDAALGRLIEWYKTYTTDEALIKRLRELKGERDRIAHQGYLLNLEEQRDDDFLRQEAAKLEEAHQRAKACLEALQPEMQRTDDLVKSIYAELRAKRLAQGVPTPLEPPVEGVTDSKPSAL